MNKPAKMAKMQPRFGGSLLWPTTCAGHELGGSASHQSDQWMLYVRRTVVIV